MNALDYFYKEWNDKAAGFVGYGAAGATTAVKNLRMMMAELKVADVRDQVRLSFFPDFENFSDLKLAVFQEKSVHAILIR